MNGDTVVVITVPQAKQVNRVYNANELLISNNEALTKHVASLDSLIDQKDTLLNIAASNATQWATVSDSLFNANTQIGEQLKKSQKQTKRAFWIGSALGAGMIILTVFLVR